MAHRFFVSKLPDGDSGTLSGDQAKHAAQVMRFQPGDQIILFDGQGTEVLCGIVDVAKKALLLSVIERRQVDRALKVLKRQINKEGLFKELKRRRFYEKPSVKKKRKMNEAKKKRKVAMRRSRSTWD